MAGLNDDALTRQYSTPANLSARIALHERFGSAVVPWQTWVFDQLELRPGDRLLEVGCGTGALWRANAGRVPEGVRLTLTDRSAGMLDRARDAIGATLVAADVGSLPFTAGSFDIAVANHMLYHATDPGHGIAELARVLAPEGRLIATTNGAGHLQEIEELIAAYGEAPGPSVAARFALENGGHLLAEHFSSVTVRRRDDVLRVDDPDALVAYVASMQRGPASSLDLEALREDVTRKIRRDGAIELRTSSGLFLARTPL
jgi:SAM-dependent methyltransferase